MRQCNLLRKSLWGQIMRSFKWHTEAFRSLMTKKLPQMQNKCKRSGCMCLRAALYPRNTGVNSSLRGLQSETLTLSFLNKWKTQPRCVWCCENVRIWKQKWKWQIHISTVREQSNYLFVWLTDSFCTTRAWICPQDGSFLTMVLFILVWTDVSQMDMLLSDWFFSLLFLVFLPLLDDKATVEWQVWHTAKMPIWSMQQLLVLPWQTWTSLLQPYYLWDSY